MSDIVRHLQTDALGALRGVLLAEPPLEIRYDDFEFHPEMQRTDAVEAAVLFPLVMGPQPALLFTRRTEKLARHSGQVSFPGGRRDPGDLSGVETALRETREETGIDPAFVSVAGFLPRYRTGTGFNILPVIGVLADGFALAPDSNEVAEIFQVPLSFFLDPANRKEESRELRGRLRQFYAYHPGRHHIWGATAALVHDFVSRLAALDEAVKVS